MAGLILEQLTKDYPNGVRAVHDLSLSVADGERVVLVGPSGCGKTTTLRLIAGLEQPTNGTIRLGGQVVNGRPPHRRDVAMVFQRPALYPHLNVAANLAFGLRLRRSHLWPPWGSQSDDVEIEGLVMQAARMLGLEAVLDRRPNQLSGGQQQRVALGRAIVRRPAVLLLDEPLSGLDAPLRTEMRRELHLLQRRLSITMIYVTHDQVEAMALGDRVVVLDRGTLQQVGPPRVLYERPCNRFVAGFIGWPPMNFLDGRLGVRDNQTGLSLCDHWLPLPPERARDLAPYAGRQVTLGIRPEHVAVATTAGPSTIPLEVVLVEPLGDRWLLTLRRDDRRLIALLDRPGEAVEGQTVMASMDLEHAHWFDQPTGASLDPAGPEG